MKLYELNETYRQFEVAFNMAESIEEQEEILAQLYELEGDILDKIDNMAAYVKNLAGDIDKFKQEERRLADKRKAMQNKSDSLKSYIEYSLGVLGQNKVKTRRFNVRKQANSQFTMNVETEEFIPKEYYIPQDPKLDTQELKRDIVDNGLYVKGVEVYKGEHIRIT